MRPKVLRADPTVRFEYHLARELGMTHEELLRRMSGVEFAYWMALYREEHYEREKAQKQAAGRARARQMASTMRSGAN